MSLPTSYLTSFTNLKEILEAIQSAQAPKKFTVTFLQGLGYKGTVTSGPRPPGIVTDCRAIVLLLAPMRSSGHFAYSLYLCAIAGSHTSERGASFRSGRWSHSIVKLAGFSRYVGSSTVVS